MKLALYASLADSFHRADLHRTQLGDELYDTKGEIIGYIPIDRVIFVLNGDYSHLELAKGALIRNSVPYNIQSGIDALYGQR